MLLLRNVPEDWAQRFAGRDGGRGLVRKCGRLPRNGVKLRRWAVRRQLIFLGDDSSGWTGWTCSWSQVYWGAGLSRRDGAGYLQAAGGSRRAKVE